VGTVDKGIELIELLSEHSKGLTLKEMSSMLGLNKSTVHRIAKTYLSHGYVAQDPDLRKYCLSMKFLSISSKILGSFDLREVAKKDLVEIHEQTREITQLYVLRDRKQVCIDKIGLPRQGLAIASAAGKVLLSELDLEEILAIYPKKSLKAYGKNTITNFDEFLKELKCVRAQGYAIDDEEYYEGVRCVAAPIRANGKIVASVSVTGSIFRITTKRIGQHLIPLIKGTADKISKKLIDVTL
jgi:IclR family KDG regulon transcriptional repressor